MKSDPPERSISGHNCAGKVDSLYKYVGIRATSMRQTIQKELNEEAKVIGEERRDRTVRCQCHTKPPPGMHTNMDNTLAITTAILAGLAGWLVFRWRTDPLRSIPTVGGSSFPGLSLIAALNFVQCGGELLAEGCKKQRDGIFKVALFDKWVVVLCGTKNIDEVRKRPEEDFSPRQAALEVTQAAYTSGKGVLENDYMTILVKDHLTRHLSRNVHHIVDEVQASLGEYMIAGEDSTWTSVNTLELVRNVVSRVVSRTYVGLPLCRDERFLSVVKQYVLDFMKTIAIMSVIPQWLKRIMGPIVSRVRWTVARASPFLLPYIKERRLLMAKLKDWQDKPEDMLQWILDKDVSRGASDDTIIERLLALYFIGMHTTIMSTVHAVHDLIAHPDVLNEVRAEAGHVLEAEGWTMPALGKLQKMDNFLRESQRFTGITIASMFRKAMRDVRLSNGTFIPKGTIVMAAVGPMHHDEDIYPDPDVFDPYRFSHSLGHDGQQSRQQFTATSPTYLPFGHGPHACPGRFYVTLIMKAIIASLVTNYDLKFGGDGNRPRDACIAIAVNPPSGATLHFRNC